MAPSLWPGCFLETGYQRLCKPEGFQQSVEVGRDGASALFAQLGRPRRTSTGEVN